MKYLVLMWHGKWKLRKQELTIDIFNKYMYKYYCFHSINLSLSKPHLNMKQYNHNQIFHIFMTLIYANLYLTKTLHVSLWHSIGYYLSDSCHSHILCLHVHIFFRLLSEAVQSESDFLFIIFLYIYFHRYKIYMHLKINLFFGPLLILAQ